MLGKLFVPNFVFEATAAFSRLLQALYHHIYQQMERALPVLLLSCRAPPHFSRYSCSSH